MKEGGDERSSVESVVWLGAAMAGLLVRNIWLK